MDDGRGEGYMVHFPLCFQIAHERALEDIVFNINRQYLDQYILLTCSYIVRLLAISPSVPQSHVPTYLTCSFVTYLLYVSPYQIRINDLCVKN